MTRDEPHRQRTLSRRAFLTAAASAAGGLLAGATAPAQEKSRVVLARARELESILNTYNYQKLLDLLTEAVKALSGEHTDAEARRRYFGVSDSAAVQIAASPVGVIPEVVDAVITTIGRAGVAKDKVFIYSADEGELYRAGFGIEREGPGIRCYGARSEGYRDSITDLLAPEVTALANVPCLSPHPVVGLAGALHNFVNSVTLGCQHEAYGNGGARLPAVLAKRALSSRVRLHVMDCVRPAYDLPDDGPPARWEYSGLLVSTDPVAMDCVATALLQTRRREVAGGDWPLDPFPTHIEVAADRYDLGIADLGRIEILRIGPMDDALI